MILPDVNVLVYAFRPDADHHAQCRDWLNGVISGDAAYGIAPQVLGSFLRVVTSARVFHRPDRLDAALSFCAALTDQPHCQLIQPGPRHWEIFVDVCRRSGAVGNLVADAWFAALAIETGCEWVTTDGDYARFPGLKWRSPLHRH